MLEKKNKFRKPIESVRFPTALMFTEGTNRTSTDVRVNLVGQKKAETYPVLHNFCPFCGADQRKNVPAEAEAETA